MSPYTLVFKIPFIYFVVFNGRTCGLDFPVKPPNDRSIFVEGDGEQSDTFGISLLHKDPVKRWKRLTAKRVKLDEKVDPNKHPEVAEAIQDFRKQGQGTGLNKSKQRIVYKQQASGKKERRFFVARYGTDSVDPTLQVGDDVRKDDSIRRSSIRKNSSSYFRRNSRSTAKPLSLQFPAHSPSKDDIMDRHSTMMNSFGKNTVQHGILQNEEPGPQSNHENLVPVLDAKSQNIRPEEALSWTRNGSEFLGKLHHQDRIYMKGTPLGVMKRNKTVQKSSRRRKVVEGTNITAPTTSTSDQIKVKDDFPKLWKVRARTSDSSSGIHTSDQHKSFSPTVQRHSHESSSGNDTISSNHQRHQPALREYTPRGEKISKRQKSKGESHSARKKSDVARSKASRLSSSQLAFKRVEAITRDESPLRKSLRESTNIYLPNDPSRQQHAAVSSISLLSTSNNALITDDIVRRETLDSHYSSSWQDQITGNTTMDLHPPHVDRLRDQTGFRSSSPRQSELVNQFHSDASSQKEPSLRPHSLEPAARQFEHNKTRSNSQQHVKNVSHNHYRGSEYIPGAVNTVQRTTERSRHIPNQYPEHGQRLTHMKSSLEKNSSDKVHAKQEEQKGIGEQDCKCKQILSSLSQSMFQSPLLPFPQNPAVHITSTEKPTEHDTKLPSTFMVDGKHWKVSSHENSTEDTSPARRYSISSNRQILGNHQEIMPHNDAPQASTAEPEKVSQPVSTTKPAADGSKDGRGVYFRKSRINQQNPIQYSQVILNDPSNGQQRPPNFGNAVSYSNRGSLTPTVIVTTEEEDGDTVSQTIIKRIKQPKAGTYEVRTGGDQIQRPTIFQTAESVGVSNNQEYNQQTLNLERKQGTRTRQQSQRPQNPEYSQGPLKTENTRVTLNREQSLRPQNRVSNQGYLIRQYGQGQSVGGYDQGSLNSKYDDRPLNVEYRQAALSPGQKQVPMNGEYNQGALNEQYYQGTLNREYNQEALNRQYNQQASNLQYNQGVSNGQYNQGVSNGQYNQGVSNRQYSQGTLNGQYNQGTLNGGYNQGTLTGDHNQGTLNRVHNQASPQQLQNDTFGVRLIEEGFQANRYGLSTATLEPESNQSRISLSKIYGTKISQDHSDTKQVNISIPAVMNSEVTGITTYQTISPTNQSATSVNSSAAGVSVHVPSGTILNENVKSGSSTVKFESLVSSEEIFKVVLKPKILTNITDVTKAPEVVLKLKTNLDSEERSSTMGPLTSKKINLNQATATRNITKQERIPDVNTISESTPENAVSMVPMLESSRENVANVTSNLKSIPENASTVTQAIAGVTKAPQVLLKLKTNSDSEEFSLAMGPLRLKQMYLNQAIAAGNVTKPQKASNVTQILKSKPENAPTVTQDIAGVTKAPQVLLKLKTNSDSEEFSAAMGPLRLKQINLNQASARGNVTKPEKASNVTQIPESNPENIPTVTKVLESPDVLTTTESASGSEVENFSLRPTVRRHIQFIPTSDTTTTKNIGDVDSQVSKTEILKSSEEDPRSTSPVSQMSQMKPTEQPEGPKGTRELLKSSEEDLRSTTPTPPISQTKSKEQSEGPKSTSEALKSSEKDPRSTSPVPKISQTKPNEQPQVLSSTTEALKSSEEDPRSTSPIPQISQMKSNDRPQGPKSTTEALKSSEEDPRSTSHIPQISQMKSNDRPQGPKSTTEALKSSEEDPRSTSPIPQISQMKSNDRPQGPKSTTEALKSSEEDPRSTSPIPQISQMKSNDRPQGPKSTTEALKSSEEDPRSTSPIPQISQMKSNDRPQGPKSTTEALKSSEEDPRSTSPVPQISQMKPNDQPVTPTSTVISETLTTTDKSWTSDKDQSTMGPATTKVVLVDEIILSVTQSPKGQTSMPAIVDTLEEQLQVSTLLITSKPMSPMKPIEQSSLPDNLLSTTESPSIAIRTYAPLGPKNSSLSNKVNLNVIRMSEGNNTKILESSDEGYGSQGPTWKRPQYLNQANAMARPSGLNSTNAFKISEPLKPPEENTPTVLQKETTKKPELNNTTKIRSTRPSENKDYSTSTAKSEISLTEKELEQRRNTSREKNDQNSPSVINHQVNQNNYFVIVMPNHNGTSHHQLKAVDVMSEDQDTSKSKPEQPWWQQVQSHVDEKGKELQKSHSAEKGASSPKPESQVRPSELPQAVKGDATRVKASNTPVSSDKENGKGSGKNDEKIKMQGNGRENMESEEQANYSEETYKTGSKGGNAQGASSKHDGHDKKSHGEDASYEESIEYFHSIEESHENQDGGHAQHGNHSNTIIKDGQDSQTKRTQTADAATVNQGGSENHIQKEAKDHHPELMYYDDYEYEYYSDEEYESESSSHNASSSTSTKNSGTIVNAGEIKASKVTGSQQVGASITKPSQSQNQGLEVQNASALKVKSHAGKSEASANFHSDTAHAMSQVSQSAHKKLTDSAQAKSQESQSAQKKHTETAPAKSQASQTAQQKLTKGAHANSQASQSAQKKQTGPTHAKSEASQSAQKKQTDAAHAKSQASESSHKNFTGSTNAKSNDSQSAHKIINGPSQSKSQVSQSTPNKKSGKAHGSAKQTEYSSYEDDYEMEYYSESSSSSFETFSHSSNSSSSVNSSSKASSSSTSARGGSAKALHRKNGESKAKSSKLHSSAASKTKESQNSRNAKQSNGTQTQKTQEKSNIKVKLETSKGRKPN